MIAQLVSGAASPKFRALPVARLYNDDNICIWGMGSGIETSM